jgi:hypothetical protein
MTVQKTIKVSERADEVATRLSETFGMPKAQVVEIALRKIAEDVAANGGLCVRPVAKSKKGVAIGSNAGNVSVKQGK